MAAPDSETPVPPEPAPLNPHTGWAYPIIEFPADTLFGSLGGLTAPPEIRPS